MWTYFADISIMKVSANTVLILKLFFVLGLFIQSKALATACIQKNETVGLLSIHQMIENGQCILIIHQNDPVLIQKNKGTLKSIVDTSKRRYTFTQSRFIELFDPDKSQEFQFTSFSNDLKYSISNKEITVQLPSGQKMILGESLGGQVGNIKSFQGFKSAKETSSGLEITPNNLDALLASSPTFGSFAHEKKKSPFSLITSNGKVATITSEQIFTKSENTYPTLNLKAFNQFSKSQPPLQNSQKIEVSPQKVIKLEKVEIPETVKLSAPVSQVDDCKNFDQLLKGLNKEYLLIQGELTLSKLAYFYLKDSDQPTETLKLKINRLLKESDLKDKQQLLNKKIAVNSNLMRLKNRLQIEQKKWSTPESLELLLNDTDFQYFSLLNAVEKKTDQKKSVINLINMIDSSYRNSENTIEQKFLALDLRFKTLQKNKSKILSRIELFNSRCSVEAQAACPTCKAVANTDNVANLKAATEKAELQSEIQWGAFWLHTGKKGPKK